MSSTGPGTSGTGPVGTPERSRLPVGRQVRRWRQERGLTLARVAERAGLNIGYLSQIENDKASPSLACLGSLGEALDVPPAWFLLHDAPAPTVVRGRDRSHVTTTAGRIEFVDGRASRDLSVIEIQAAPGARIELHAHAGDEHHLVLAGRFRGSQGPHVVELGPGDYLRWDGAIPHDGEVVGEEALRMLIFRIGSSG